MAKIKAYVINHGHMDIEWYKPLDSYRFWVKDAIDRLWEECNNKENYVSYIFDGSVFLLDDLIAYDQSYKEKIIELIKKRKLITGPFYTQFDEFIPSAECMVKNCLWGDRISKKYGGKPMKVGYLPDNFGHPQQLPQIMNNFGIDSLLFMRGMVDLDNDSREFKFIGIDGSELKTVNYNYSAAFLFANNNPGPNNPRYLSYYDKMNVSYDFFKSISVFKDKELLAKVIIEDVKNQAKLFPSGNILLSIGSDHCPPITNLGDVLETANQIQNDIDFIFCTPEEYFEALNNFKGLQTFKGELIGSYTDYILFGVLSSRIYQKIACFSSQTMLYKYALPLQSLSEFISGKHAKYKKSLEKAVRYTLLNSTHDSIHGSSVDEVHNEITCRNSAINQITSEIIFDSIKNISESMGKWWNDESKGLISYNANAFKGYQLCSVWLPIGNDTVSITDKEGNKLPTVVYQRELPYLNAKGEPYYRLVNNEINKKVEFLAKLHPFGLQTFSWEKSEQRKSEVLNEKYIENEFLIVSFNDGFSISIKCKDTGIIYDNLNILSEKPDAGDAWNYSEPYNSYKEITTKNSIINSIETMINGFEKTMRICGYFTVPYELCGDNRSEKTVNMDYSYEIKLYDGIKRIDIKLNLNNTAKDHIVSLEIPINMKTDIIKSQGAFGIVERNIDKYVPKRRWVENPTEFFPFNEWLSVDDKINGLAIAFKGLCAYCAEKENNKVTVSVPLVRSYGILNKMNLKTRRSPIGGNWLVPDAQCLRTTEYEWSYIPYNANENDKTPFIDNAEGFLYPPVISYMTNIFSQTKTDKIMPFEILKGDVRISIFDKSYNDEFYVLRLFENQGKKESVQIKFNKKVKVYKSNLNEELINIIKNEDNICSLIMDPYKICTLLISKQS